MRKQGTKNLTYYKRQQIETLLNANVDKKEIANIVGISLRTLYYEIKRGEYTHIKVLKNFWYGNKTLQTKKYSADISQEKYNLACTSKGRPLKIGNDFKTIEYIEKRFKEDNITPHATIGQIKRNNLPYTKFSKTTLYRYIELGLFNGIKISKRISKYRQTKKAKRISKGLSIEQRPQEVLQRNTFGHWEMDCVCGPNKESLLVLSERLTRKEILFKINRQTLENVVNCLDKLERKYGSKKFKQIFKSITVDNGSEFSNFALLQKSCLTNGKRTDVYYCHPYCSSERGTNERLNREIRRLIPKGSNISLYTIKQIKQVENWLNNYPRSVLGYATSQELFDNQLKILA